MTPRFSLQWGRIVWRTHSLPTRRVAARGARTNLIFTCRWAWVVGAARTRDLPAAPRRSLPNIAGHQAQRDRGPGGAPSASMSMSMSMDVDEVVELG